MLKPAVGRNHEFLIQFSIDIDNNNQPRSYMLKKETVDEKYSNTNMVQKKYVYDFLKDTKNHQEGIANVYNYTQDGVYLYILMEHAADAKPISSRAIVPAQKRRTDTHDTFDDSDFMPIQKPLTPFSKNNELHGGNSVTGPRRNAFTTAETKVAPTIASTRTPLYDQFEFDNTSSQHVDGQHDNREEEPIQTPLYDQFEFDNTSSQHVDGPHDNRQKEHVPHVSTEVHNALAKRLLYYKKVEMWRLNNIIIQNELSPEQKSHLIDALKYLHDNDILHGDVFDDNVIISTNRTTAKLIDFGCSFHYDLKNTNDLSLVFLRYDKRYFYPSPDCGCLTIES
jgi:serine/threonine protein kinase